MTKEIYKICKEGEGYSVLLSPPLENGNYKTVMINGFWKNYKINGFSRTETRPDVAKKMKDCFQIMPLIHFSEISKMLFHFDLIEFSPFAPPNIEGLDKNFVERLNLAIEDHPPQEG